MILALFSESVKNNSVISLNQSKTQTSSSTHRIVNGIFKELESEPESLENLTNLETELRDISF